VRGGQELLACLQTHLPRITHLHLKDGRRDAIGTGVLGDGICDYPAIAGAAFRCRLRWLAGCRRKSANARRTVPRHPQKPGLTCGALGLYGREKRA